MPNIDEDAKRWQVELAGRIGAAVAQWRKKRGLTAVELSEKTAALGYPVSRIAISKIEQGKRAGKMDLSELLVLARALAVPPVLLMYSDQMDGEVEAIPGQRISSFLALRWFSGEGIPNPYVLPAPRQLQGNESPEAIENTSFLEAAEPLELARALFANRERLRGVMHLAARSDNTPEQHSEFMRIAETYQDEGRRILREMHSRGMVVDDE